MMLSPQMAKAGSIVEVDGTTACGHGWVNAITVLFTDSL